MRVLGAIMFIVGVLLTLTMFLPVLIFIFMENNDAASTAMAAIILGFILGAPCFLLIFFGARLFRKRQAARQVPPPHAQSFVPEPVAATHAALHDSYAAAERTGAARQHKAVVPLDELFNGAFKKVTDVKRSRTTPPPPPIPKTVACRNCGASKNVSGGEKAACDYCGTVLN